MRSAILPSILFLAASAACAQTPGTNAGGALVRNLAAIRVMAAQ